MYLVTCHRWFSLNAGTTNDNDVDDWIEMPNQALARKIYALQNNIVRELNNAHIFLDQAHPLLLDARSKYDQSESDVDRRYYVPSIAKSKYAQRTDVELMAIYDHYASAGLFEAFLVASVSQFESFLADVLITFFKVYPKRITETVQGIPACPSVSAKDLIAATNKEDLVQSLLAEHVANVFRQRPSIYMTYVVKMLGVKNDASFADLYEVAATRDLVVHNGNVINALYLDKSGAKARGSVGAKLAVDRDYFSSVLARLKKVAGAIKRDVEEKYGKVDEGGQASILASSANA